MPEGVHYLAPMAPREVARVEALGLSRRTLDAVVYNRLTLDELRQTSDEVLCRCDFLGPGRVAEIRRAFAMREADVAPPPWWAR